MGKVLDETHEHAGKYDNLPFFLRYKENNPSKLVLLHYHGAGWRATDTTTGFFADHWLHYKGTNLSLQVDASRLETVLHVVDTSVFSLDRVEGIRDDIVIAPVDEDGEPDWESAEQMKLEEIDAENETITVERGAYRTEVRFFPAGSYLAAHILPEPYPSESPPHKTSLCGATTSPRSDRETPRAVKAVTHW